jgi:CBS domain-containing protein
MTIESILKNNGNHFTVTSPSTSISEVIEMFEANNVGAMVVSADEKHIDGIISERDIVRGLRRSKADVLNQFAGDLMTKNVITCSADEVVVKVMSRMNVNNIRHLPVLNDGLLVGIVSIQDIVQHRLGELQHESDAMRDYINQA